MREIRFRAYRKDTKERGEILAIEFDGKYTVIRFYTSDYECCYEKSYQLDDKDLILSRYTGLKDKNGKEIYEFDECDVTRTCIWARGYITFRQGCFIFREYKTGNILRLCDLELNGYEIKVTGTALNNPELLEQEESEV